MTKLVIDPGICGFTVTVQVNKISAERVSVAIDSDCEIVSQLARQLRELDWQDALKPGNDSSVYKFAFSCIKHPGCPVPVAILKAIEVEAGAALPKDVTIQFTTETQ